MLVSDIWQEVVEATGSCDDAVNYRALTRAVELLANEGLFDPLIGTIDFMVDGGYLIALPRDVKTPLRLNINNNPAFARNRIFEFAPNTNGSQDGPEIGWQWHERGYSPIQDETKLPSKLRYNVTVADDIGKTITVFGTDTSGRRRKESLIGAMASPILSRYVYGEVISVVRQPTVDEAYIYADTGGVSRYYPDELQPEYRVIKLSQTGVAVRMMYRKHVFKLSAQDDIIPLHSAMAVIRAVEAVRLMQIRKFEEGQAVLTEAVRMISKEQEARGDQEVLASKYEIQTAINTNSHAANMVIAADVYDEAADIFGPAGRAKLFDRMTDAVQLLSNKSAWDSMVATVLLTSDASGSIVLPRHVFAPLAVNVANNPSFARSRLFEFTLNTNGHEDGEVVGYSWALDEETPLFAELPSASVLTLAGDGGDSTLALNFFGFDAGGKEIQESINVGTTGAKVFKKVTRVLKPVTAQPVTVSAGATQVASYYADETEPLYRKLKTSKPSTALRVLFKKRSPHITSLSEPIPLRSRMAVVLAMRAVKSYQDKDTQVADALIASAVSMLQDEMRAAVTPEIEQVLTATNTNILTNDLLIVADIYDRASEIIGAVGRAKIFDRITDAIEALKNKTQWDSLLCNADVCRAANMQASEDRGNRSGFGYFVLPRYVDTVLAVNVGGQPLTPRNRWFEFHLNGPGSRWMGCEDWKDADDVCVINGFPRDGSRAVPCRLLAVPDSSLDADKAIRAFGIERLSDGTEVEVVRNGAKGFLVPQKVGAYTFPDGSPQWVRIDRIQRAETVGFVKLLAKPVDATADVTMGYYYPDEVAPTYRMIKVAGAGRYSGIRIRFRKRTHKVAALTDVINLRSRLAIENMLRALVKQETDPAAAALNEQIAIGYLEEEQVARNPHGGGTLQFEPGMSPGEFLTIQ